MSYSYVPNHNQVFSKWRSLDFYRFKFLCFCLTLFEVLWSQFLMRWPFWPKTILRRWGNSLKSFWRCETDTSFQVNMSTNFKCARLAIRWCDSFYIVFRSDHMFLMSLKLGNCAGHGRIGIDCCRFCCRILLDLQTEVLCFCSWYRFISKIRWTDGQRCCCSTWICLAEFIVPATNTRSPTLTCKT